MGKQINFKFGISNCLNCNVEFQKKKLKQKLCKSCKSINMKIYMKTYSKAYYLKNRVLKGFRSKISYSPIKCVVCGINTNRTGSAQKVCISCKPEYMRKHRLNWFKNKYKNDFDFRKRRQELTRKNGRIWVSRHPEENLISRRIRENNRRAVGKIDRKVFQMIYEDNIKKYGTLTCILCLKTIGFGEDSLEHKTPIKRGGTNEYSNLGVSHLKCNISKHTKTVEEYQNYIGIKE